MQWHEQASAFSQAAAKAWKYKACFVQSFHIGQVNEDCKGITNRDFAEVLLHPERPVLDSLSTAL